VQIYKTFSFKLMRNKKNDFNEFLVKKVVQMTKKTIFVFVN
jgi:hypothetical protein